MFFIYNSNILFIYCILIGVVISTLLIVLTLLFAPSKFSYEKNNPYECGFQPFEDSRSKFEIKYYLVAILYIIFDLELMFLLPWILFLFNINLFSVFIFLVFVIVLLIGFVYEWLKGALRWS